MAKYGCLAAAMSPLGLGGIGGGIPGCILGAGYYAVVSEVLSATEASPHIKIGAGIASVSPWLAPLGVLVTAVGAILSPSVITWSKDWDFTILDKPLIAPWALPKEYVAHEVVFCSC